MKKLTSLTILIMLYMNISANVSLPAIFQDNMVIQQQSTLRIWGWGKPNEEIKITVGWDTLEYKTTTPNQAEWHIDIPTPKADNKTYTIQVQGYNLIEIKNIMLGEVWLCSGQSNMEWTARMGINNAQEEVQNANYPNIRLFNVTHRAATTPNYDIDGSWTICTPETMQDFSAAAYFFARETQKELGVPIGLINASWGGTPIEVWIPEANILNDSALLQASQKIEEMEWSPREPGRLYNAMIAPVTQFSIAGVIWYQGETNTANPETYHKMMEALINSWRNAWDKDLPFYYAQIAPFNYGEGTSGVELQNAQRKALAISKRLTFFSSVIKPSAKSKYTIILPFSILWLLYKGPETAN